MKYVVAEKYVDCGGMMRKDELVPFAVIGPFESNELATKWAKDIGLISFCVFDLTPPFTETPSRWDEMDEEEVDDEHDS